jgi:(4S)-4-hydroxy-5-phosphonooxypentane-2,3-dione isomerase
MNADHAGLNRRSFCKLSAVTAAGSVATIGFQRLARAEDTDAKQPISQIARFKLNLDKEAEGLEALKELCKAVEENEPGVLAYVCHRTSKKPEELVFFEVYKDEAAMKAHGAAPHLAKIRKLFGTVFLPPLEVTRLDRIGGFTR